MTINSMNKLLKIGFLIALLSLGSVSVKANCDDPVAAVLNVMSCIEDENAYCAARGYASDFVKIHNGVDTETPALNFFFWLGTFYMIDFNLEFDHIAPVDENQVSLRYVETVEFRDGETFTQHEHALVTVNNRCKMTRWDQYGDNKEQQDVEEKADSLFPF